jgi:uncharacterized repeat protein (TIGR03806 family)
MRALLLAGLLLVIVTLSSCDRRSTIQDVASGFETRPVPQGCQGFDARPGEARAVRAYPALSFDTPIALVRQPNAPFWYVLEQGGTIRRFADRADVSTAELVMDLRDLVGRLGYEDGLLGLAFTPSFATTGEVILKYTVLATDDPTRVRLVIARARSADGGASIAPGSIRELLSIERPSEAIHHGGAPAYGLDGYLYVPIGDGGYDTGHLAQDRASLAGKFLRLDVSQEPYAIPPDNPFASVAGTRPEIFAIGFRNPHSWSFDPDAPLLWVGDVGLHSYEELNRVRAGENFGWPVREGAHCRDDLPCDPTGLVDPVHEYVHFGGGAIVGGPIYRGTRFPALRDHVVFGDFVSGRIDYVDRASSKARLLVDSGRNITSFAVRPDGELLFLEYLGGVWSIEPNADRRSVPARLSDTGCVDMARPARAPAGLIPYDVAMPLWSDGTEKTRWMAVPDGATIRIDEEGAFVMPTGSVLVKTFFSGKRPIETRLFTRHAEGDWAGYTYEWTDDGSEAHLLEIGKVKDVAGKPYTFPSRAQCLACHTPAAGFTLGLETSQLNHSIVYPDNRRANQLATLEHVGLFDEPLGSPALLPRFPERDDASAEPADWARAYLHANCSHCHRPGSGGLGNGDLRFSSPLADVGCDAVPFFEVLGREDPRVIVPGNPDASIMVARLGEGAERMPPLATWIVDTLAVNRVRSWIRGLDSCSPAP